MEKAIVLFSGGIDSTVVLASALSRHRECITLSFDYGQKHIVELAAAEKIARHYGVVRKQIKIDPSSFALSSLVTEGHIPVNRTFDEISNGGIPSTYVPARNTIFLAFALALCEVYNASEVHFGPNIYDRKPYPDCRPEYVDAFQNLYDVATKRSVEGSAPKIIAPLIDLDKFEIVKLGKELNAPLHLTHSCYNPGSGGSPCQICDACTLRNMAYLPD